MIPRARIGRIDPVALIVQLPAKSYYFPATREASQVQIANALIEASSVIHFSN
jgi:hypothetical protein